MQVNEMEDPSNSKYRNRDVSTEQEVSDVEMKERIAAVITTFKRNLQDTESRLAHVLQENVDLRIQIKQLLNPSRQGANAAPAAVPVAQGEGTAPVLEQQAQQYSIMYQNLTKEIQDLRKELVASRAREREKDMKVERLERQESTRLSSRSAAGTPISAVRSLGELNMPVHRVPSAPSSIADGGRKGAEMETSPLAAARSKTELKDIAGPVSQSAVTQQDTALKAQLIASEQRAAEMSVRQVQLEEELKAYQNYMKEILPQYQRMLKDRGRSGELRPSNASRAAAKEILKLPSLQNVQNS